MHFTATLCLQASRLQQEVQKGEQNFGTAEGQISTLKEAQDKLLEELDATRARLRETSNLLTALQVRHLPEFMVLTVAAKPSVHIAAGSAANRQNIAF